MDLRVTEPRPLDAELDGYAWLPRMLDKARGHLAGTPGSYMFGCPVDHTCMARLGVTPDLVLELAGRYDDDGDVLRALQEHGIPSAAEAWFDGPAVEAEIQEHDRYLRVRRLHRLELAPGETQPLSAELITAGEGTPTVFLGRWQARRLAPGEVAFVPPDVPVRVENRSSATCVVSVVGRA